MTIEVVLPSGKFATLRPILWGDWLRAINVVRELPMLNIDTVLMIECVQIDGEPVTYSQLQALDIRDGLAISRMIGEALTAPVKA